MTWSEKLTIAVIGATCYFAGVFFARATRKRTKAFPRCMVIAYRMPDAADISVNACACGQCKNVVWAQRVSVEAPKYCAYCGLKYDGIEVVGDAEMESRGMIIPD